MIHAIKTDASGTNDNSAYNVLDLPFGYFLLLSLVTEQISQLRHLRHQIPTLRQGNASLFLWDTIGETFYQEISLPDVFCHGSLNVNGRM